MQSYLMLFLAHLLLIIGITFSLKGYTQQDSILSPAFSADYNDGPHDINAMEFEGWYYYGYFKSDTSSSNEWYIFGSWGHHAIGAMMTYNLVNLNTGQKYVQGLVKKNVPMPLIMPDNFRTVKKVNEKRVFPSSVWEFSMEENYFVKRGFHYNTQIVDQDFTLKMEMFPVRPVVYTNGTGLNGIKKEEHSHYYFYPKLEISGTLETGGVVENINGSIWYEHIWGKTWPPMWVKWNWWALELETGEIFNLYFINNVLKDKEVSSLITMQDSTGKTFVFEEIKYTSGREWVSQKSKTTYPVEWKVEVPEWGYDLHITPVYDDSEVPTLGPAWFWEGPCNVVAIHRDTKVEVSGRGTQELIGYGAAQMIGK